MTDLASLQPQPMGAFSGDLLAAPAPVPVPKVSVPAVTAQRLFASVANIAPDTVNGNLHATDTAMYLTAETPAGGPLDQVIVCSSVLGIMQLAITPGDPSNSKDAPLLLDNWNIGLSFPMIPEGREVTGPTPPDTQFSFHLTSSTAKLAGISHPPADRAAELSAAGWNTWCIATSGASSILTTIVACLPALAGGKDSFVQALKAALGPGGVDLAEKVSKCF